MRKIFGICGEDDEHPANNNAGKRLAAFQRDTWESALS